MHPMQQIRRRDIPSLGACLREGFYFCTRCERVLDANNVLGDEAPHTCARCRKAAVVWHPGIELPG